MLPNNKEPTKEEVKQEIADEAKFIIPASTSTALLNLSQLVTQMLHHPMQLPDFMPAPQKFYRDSTQDALDCYPISFKGRYLAYQHSGRALIQPIMKDGMILDTRAGPLNILDLTDKDKITSKGTLAGKALFLTALPLPGNTPRFVTISHVDSFQPKQKTIHQLKFCIWNESQLEQKDLKDAKPSSKVIIDVNLKNRKHFQQPWLFLKAFLDGRHLAMGQEEIAILDLQKGVQRVAAIKPENWDLPDNFIPAAVLASNCLAWVSKRTSNMYFYPTRTNSQGDLSFFLEIGEEANILCWPNILDVCAWPDGQHLAFTEKLDDEARYHLNICEFAMVDTFPSVVPRKNILCDEPRKLSIVSGQLLFEDTETDQHGRSVNKIRFFSPEEGGAHDLTQSDSPCDAIFQGFHGAYVLNKVGTGHCLQKISRLTPELIESKKDEIAKNAISTHLPTPGIQNIVMSYLGNISFFNDSLKKETPVLNLLKPILEKYKKQFDTGFAQRETKIDAKQSVTEENEHKISESDVEFEKQVQTYSGLDKLFRAISKISLDKYSSRIQEVFSQYPILRKLEKEDKKFAEVCQLIRALDKQDSKPSPKV